MVGQILPNNNESATRIFPKKFSQSKHGLKLSPFRLFAKIALSKALNFLVRAMKLSKIKF
jgi:hypothetical protein